MEQQINLNNHENGTDFSSNENLHSEVAIASPKLRLYGFLLDALPFVVMVLILAGLTYLLDNGNMGNIEQNPFIYLFAIIVLFIAVVNIMLIIYRGQTLGKHWLNIAIVKDDTGVKIGFWRYTLLREFIGRNLVIGYIPLIQIIVYPFYFIIDHAMIFGEDRKTIHDMIAGTKVIILPENKKRKKFIDLERI